MSLGLILQVIVALPKIFSVIGSLIKEIELAKDRLRASNEAKAIDQAKIAQSKEEAQKANEAITRSLP
jgi:hypothetical protein